MSLIVLKKIIEMFIILLVGVIIYKAKIINDVSTKHLSNVLLLLVSPLLIIQSYQIDFNREVFYMTAYITVFNLLLWTHGIILMGDNDGLKGAWKNFLSPAILSIVIGIILFLFQLRLPQFIENPLEMIASMNTPLGMIVAGANLAQGNILKSLKNKRLYYLSFIKLIVYPLAGLVVLWLLPLEFEVAFTVFIALACPAGASVIMFAQRYDRDAYYASEIFVITTLLSAVTIPLLSVVAVSLLS